MPIKVTLAAAVASLLLMQLSCCNASGDEEGVELEEHKPLETSAVWGYSFLFNFLGCLPSACAIVVCLRWWTLRSLMLTPAKEKQPC